MIERNPLISVVLPTYNRAHTLGRAFKSVLQQTFEDFELIVVDDGSGDNTADLLESIADDRLMTIRYPDNRGAAAARNAGIQASRGALIAFLDSDDAWKSDKLELQVSSLEGSEPGVGVVYSQFIRVKGTQERVYPADVSDLQGDLYEELLFGNLVSTQVALVRRECFEKVGLFDENLPCLLDWDLWLRISKEFRFAAVDRALAYVYFTPDGISASKRSIARALEMILGKYRLDFEARKEALAWQTYCLGNLLCLSGALTKGRGYLFRAVRMRPWVLRYGLTALISFLGTAAYGYLYTLRERVQPDWY